MTGAVTLLEAAAGRCVAYPRTAHPDDLARTPVTTRTPVTVQDLQEQRQLQGR